MNKFYPLLPILHFCKGLVKSKISLRLVAVCIFLAALVKTDISYAQYCLPVWSAPSCGSPNGDDFINDFTFNGAFNNGIGCPPVNYFDFSGGGPCLAVCTGNNYVITVTPGYYATGNDEQFAVAIDFNGNGNFSDPGEFFFLGNSFLGSTITGVVTIPAGINPINTRMRVICQTVFGPALTQNDVCGNLSSYGEAMDYCLQINATPQINLGGPYAQCGGSVNLDATNPGPGTNYAWSDNSTTQTIQASTSGNYQVTVTTSAGCVAVSNATNIYIKPVPVVDLGPDISQCAGSVTLDAGNIGTATYSWSGGSSGQTLTVNSSGTYSVTVTNINSDCTASDSATVAINAYPVINLSPSVFQCGGSVTLDAGNSGASFKWSTGATTRDLTVTNSGLYSVTATSPAGCSATAQEDVTIYNRPDIGPDIVDSICPLTTVNLYSYFQSAGIPLTYYTANPAAVGPGAYVVVGTNDNGCSDTALVSVIQKPRPNLGPNIFDTVCPNTTVDLTNLVPNNEYASYNWNAPDPKIAGPGIYTLIATSNGCADTVTASVIYSYLPVLSFTLPDNICITMPPFAMTSGLPSGGLYYIDGSENNVFVPHYLGIGPHHVEYVYTNYSTGCSDSAGANVYVRPQPFITESVPASSLCSNSAPLNLDDYFNPSGGVYSGIGVSEHYFYPTLSPPGNDTIVDVYTDQYGCMDTSVAGITITKAVHSVLYASAEDYTLCQGQNITFYSTGALNYQFFVNGIPQGGPSPDSSFTTNTLTNHSEVYVVGSNECSYDTSDLVIIDVIPLPMVYAGPDTTIILGQSVQLNGIASGSTSLIYQWTPPTGLNFVNIPNPTYSGSDTIAFWFKATDTYGCADSSMVNVYVVIPDNVLLPNVITPNGDGKNDTWKLNPKINLDGSHLVIFNRWGQTVYETDNYANDWGGTYKTLTGDKLPDDTYYYVLKVPAQNNHVYEGAINVLSGSKK